jgi:hypothetical protein
MNLGGGACTYNLPLTELGSVPHSPIILSCTGVCCVRHVTHQFAGMGVYDAMKFCKADVSTVCFGLAASMGAFLLAAGTKGKRYCMPNARIMIHQPSGGAGGKVSNKVTIVCCCVALRYLFLVRFSLSSLFN